jgi:proton-translocating NADH-quinone oxidoreductase chain N
VDYRPEWILPELYQTLIVLILFICAMIGQRKQLSVGRWIPWLAAVGIPVALVSLGSEGEMFLGAYRLDPLSQFFKFAVAVGFTVAVLNATRQPTLEENRQSDYFMFLALSALGLMFLSSAVELITIYLAMEMASYSLYTLIPLRSQEKQAAEAGIKYILFGAAATAIALYGISYIVAAQHTTYLSDLSAKDWSWAKQPIAVLGLTLFLAGFFYKLALFPFHFWAPDVYQGASNETATYVSTLPKLGAVVILIRLTALVSPGLEVTTILATLSAISMTYGNLAALAQKDVKRILGYSTVAHAGYVLVGLVAVTKEGLAAAGFYALAYVLMNLTCFWVICRVAADGRNLELEDLNGLHKRAPGLALVLAVGAFALVGFPPTAGFMGKLFLLTAAWDRGYNWLVILAAVNTAISLYYYLSMVIHAYTKDEPDTPPAPQPEPGFSLFWGTLLAVAVLLLGMVPGPVFNLATQAASSILP